MVTDRGVRVPFDSARMQTLIESACAGLGADVRPEPILTETKRNLYDGVPIDEVHKAAILAARTLIEKDPGYTRATARLLLHTIRREILGEELLQSDMTARYAEYFPQFVKKGVGAELLDEKLLQYDLGRLGAALKADRDLQFDYLGLQTLYDRYFLHIDEARIELPQAFFMRVAMGLALNEIDREERAIEFYEVLSTFDFMSSTPTLFNAGTRRSQLSSCYLTTVSDDLDGIYEALKENALLSKFAGGLGNDWTNVRALGSYIKGTNGKSQGVVPFLKVVNDTAVAVNQGGKRKGAVCAYLESWHLDIEEFLELRKNTGDDRRRTHDMNTANWVPDLLMKRVMEGGDWTLFSPSTCPDLHDKFGRAFEDAYTAYEDKAARGEIKLFKKVKAADLWRRMLTMLFETGHPWITFKDACNVRSPQQHVGVVHSSNLCTEITLNTGPTEIAVCNLGSVNLAQHIADGKLDQVKLKKTVATAMRMLDNVIDINYYAVKKARDSNLRHRPVGLGIMGFQDALYEIKVPYASDAAVEFADRSMEAVCYHAYWASTELAAGARPLFELPRLALGPRHPADRLARPARRAARQPEGRPKARRWSRSTAARRSTGRRCARRIGEHGMRNSNCVAIAPTATISNIVGVSASIEPSFGNLSVKSNLSGEFTIVNEYLVRDLKKRRPLGRRDGHGPEALRRLAEADRPRSRGPEAALRDRVRDRDAVAGRGGGAAPEVDRPGAVAQHLHGRRVGQEARRDLQARLAARPEDDLLPAHAERDQRREVDGEVEPAQRGVERRAQRRGGEREQRRERAARGERRARERRQVLRARQPGVRSVSVSKRVVIAARERVPRIARSRCNRATKSKRRD